MSTAIAVRESDVPAEIAGEYSVEQVLSQAKKIQDVMRLVMKPGEHYGTIPGTDKPTLLKPGAEVLLFTFRLDPQYEAVERYDGNHLTIQSRCVIYHIATGLRLGSGMGSCSTKESKYAYRLAARVCPQCHKEAIIKGKAVFGGGWLCFKKKEGCGAKFKETDPLIIHQPTGRVPNEDVADVYNTVLKMANKRALVAAVLNVTAASETFTQDLEDAQETPPGPPTTAVKDNHLFPPEEPVGPVVSIDRTTGEVLEPERSGDPVEADVVDIIGKFEAETDAKEGAALFHRVTKVGGFWALLTTSQQNRIIAAKDGMKRKLGVGNADR